MEHLSSSSTPSSRVVLKHPTLQLELVLPHGSLADLLVRLGYTEVLPEVPNLTTLTPDLEKEDSVTTLTDLNHLAVQIFDMAGLPPEDDQHVDEIVGQEDDEFNGYDAFDPDDEPDDYDDDDLDELDFDEDDDEQPEHDDEFDYDDEPDFDPDETQHDFGD